MTPGVTNRGFLSCKVSSDGERGARAFSRVGCRSDRGAGLPDVRETCSLCLTRLSFRHSDQGFAFEDVLSRFWVQGGYFGGAKGSGVVITCVV